MSADSISAAANVAGGALRSDPNGAVLVVIDMQEKLLQSMHEMRGCVFRAELLIKGCSLLKIPVMFTQQYTKGLGDTIPPLKDAYLSGLSSANDNVRLAASDPVISERAISFSHIEKTSFSVMDEPEFAGAIAETGRREVILCGVEAHVCVMQSALDFVRLGYAVRVAADATASRKTLDAEFAWSRMTQAGVTVTTTEALLFDLTKGATNPAFKGISALVR